SYPQHSTKSKAAAAVLAFFLGTFGAHNFYLGKKSTGLIHLGLFLGGLTLMILGAVLGVTAAENGRPDDPFFVMVLIGYLLWTVNALWAFVEFIIILVKPEYDLGR